MRWRAKAVWLVLPAMLISVDARAADTAAAQTLFDGAKKLVAEGNYADACVKFEESQKLDPGIGTLFNLADCFEHVGKNASAWGGFLDVAAQARAQRQPERAELAASRATALESKLVRLTINVSSSGARPSGLRVQRNGVDVGAGQWGTSIPLDPGEQTITASAPGKKSWRTVIQVTAGEDPAAILVPELEAEPETATPPPTPVVVAATDKTADDEKDVGSSRRVMAVAVGGVGVVGLGLGTVFGLMSQSKQDEAASHCIPGNRCDEAGVSLRDDALQNGTVSTIGFVIGGLGLVGGAVLYFTAPKKNGGNGKSAMGPSISASPLLAARAGGLSVRGIW